MAWHATQTRSREQTGVEVPEQLAFVTHCTHVDVVVSQWDLGDAHCKSDVHPVRHVNVPGLQMGAAVPQSALDRQVTHLPSDARQRGAPAGQSALTAHCTHCCVVASHTLVGA